MLWALLVWAFLASHTQYRPLMLVAGIALLAGLLVILVGFLAELVVNVSERVERLERRLDDATGSRRSSRMTSSQPLGPGTKPVRNVPNLPPAGVVTDARVAEASGPAAEGWRQPASARRWLLVTLVSLAAWVVLTWPFTLHLHDSFWDAALTADPYPQAP